MGIFDQFTNLSPEQTQGLLAFASNALQAGGSGRRVGFGEALGGGLQAYQQSIDGQRKTKAEQERAALQAQLAAQGLEAGQLSIDGQRRAAMQEQQLQGAYGEAGGDPSKLIEAVSRIDPMKGFQLRQQLAKSTEFDTKPQIGVDEQGKPFTYIVGKDGTQKRLDGTLPRDELKLANLGGKDVAYNPFSLQPGQTFQRTQTPDSIASNAVSMRGQNMTDARAREANQISGGMRSDAQQQKVRDENLTKQGQIASFDTMLDSLDRLNQAPGLSRSVGLYSKVPTIPGSDSANFQAELETFKSQAFIPMVAQLKGMGALSDAEGKKLNAAVGALDPSMSEPAFRASINRIKDTMNTARARVVDSSRESVQQGSASPQPARKSVLRGQVIDGYRFKGGDPSQQSNWEKQ